MIAVLFEMVNAASKIAADATHGALLRCIADPAQDKNFLQIPHNVTRSSSMLAWHGCIDSVVVRSSSDQTARFTQGLQNAESLAPLE
jgi:hypothetical protein